MHIRQLLSSGLVLGALLIGGCRVADDTERGAQPTAVDAGGAPAQPGADAATQQRGELRFEVSLADRELHVYRDGARIRTHPVAVGQEGHETVTGEFSIHQVDFNPRWVPPDSDWAEGREAKAPGDPDNPMGHARLIFHETYSIHGTDASGSLGEAASHGSIRVSNDVVEELGRMVMEHGGAERGDDFFRRVREQRSEMQQVSIPNPVPIVIRD
jgi:lipoprotein-anchoring transpeptidase ErfK/SrfK